MGANGATLRNSSGEQSSDVARLRGSQEPGEYVDLSGTGELSELEESIVRYTLNSNDFGFSDSAENQLRTLIRSSRSQNETLFRVETVSNRDSLQVGDTFTRAVSSWSKSEEWVNSEANRGGSSKAIFKTVGPQKSLNVQGYSIHTEQRESLAFGRFTVRSVDSRNVNGKTVTVYEVAQALS